MSDSDKNALGVPAAIVGAGVLVAGAILWIGQGGQPSAPTPSAPAAQQQVGNASAVAPITDADWVRGPRNAEVMIVEYSDIDCPFCQRYHPSLKEIVEDPAYAGKVGWAYRHLPLPMHPLAQTKALATECVGAQEGNDAFWTYLDLLIAEESSLRSDTARLAVHAVAVGADKAAFDKCLADKATLAAVTADAANAKATGGSGTPWTVVIGPNKQYKTVSGNRPADLRVAIDELLK
jgi:protein-disulfide isomerase